MNLFTQRGRKLILDKSSRQVCKHGFGWLSRFLSIGTCTCWITDYIGRDLFLESIGKWIIIQTQYSLMSFMCEARSLFTEAKMDRAIQKSTSRAISKSSAHNICFNRDICMSPFIWKKAMHIIMPCKDKSLHNHERRPTYYLERLKQHDKRIHSP